MADQPVPMKQSVHFLSKSCEWETPQYLFDGLNAEFGFDLDVCANPSNAKCRKFFTKAEDGLGQTWEGTVWMNPPYGRTIERWMKKGFESALAGTALVVCLVPARTDTRWWHKYATRGEIRYLKGRLKFGGSKNSAPFPSAIVIFRPLPLTGHDVPIQIQEINS